MPDPLFTPELAEQVIDVLCGQPDGTAYRLVQAQGSEGDTVTDTVSTWLELYCDMDYLQAWCVSVRTAHLINHLFIFQRHAERPYAEWANTSHGFGEPSRSTTAHHRFIDWVDEQERLYSESLRAR